MSEDIILRITHNDENSSSSETISVNKDFITRSKVFDLCLSTSVNNKEVCFPPQYNDIVNLYLMCLNGDKEIKNYIARYPLKKNKYNLGRLLQLLHFLEDDITFEDPLSLIKISYSTYKEVIDTLHSDLQRSIYLRLPYCFTPFDDRYFFEYWIAINSKEGEITVENIIYRSYLRSYEGDIDLGDSRYSSHQMTQFITFKNDNPHGVEKVWYPLNNSNNNPVTNNPVTNNPVTNNPVTNNNPAGNNNSNNNPVANKQLIAKIANYVDGRLHGIMKCWNDNNVLKIENNYDNGQMHGCCIQYHKTGEKKEEVHYHKGKLYGLNISYDQDGKKVIERNYVNGLKHGLEIWYNEVGNKNVEYRYKFDKRHGPTRYWHRSSGKLISEYNFVNGKQHGVSKTWYETGSLNSEENYCNGELHGETKFWYKNVPNTLEKQCNYQHGKLDGCYKSWYSNGNREHVKSYHEDKLDGMWSSWYLGGNKCLCYSYYKSKKHGVWKEWYDNDKNHLKKEYHYNNNVKHGSCKEWYTDGTLHYSTCYHNGHAVK